MINKVIVEGPDCSGKSTVVDRVKNALRWDSKSLHHKEGNQFNRYLQEYALADRVVFDRSHVSEAVYSELWRRGSPFSEEEGKILNMLLQKDSLIILSSPSVELMQERYKSRGFTQQVKFEELEESRNLFFKRFNGDKIPFIAYGSQTYEELDYLVENIRRLVNESLCDPC